MPAMFNSALLALTDPATGAISWSVDTIKVALVTPGYIFVPSHTNMAQISPFELTDGSYSRQPLTGMIQGPVDNVNNLSIFSSDPPTFASLANSVTNAAILFKDNGGADSGNPLIAYCNFNQFIATGLNFTIKLPSGWFTNQNVLGGL